ncbi:MAG TPA: ETC complex I subunit [Candidatus Sulfotelmatobacter sp.]|nr:ETC complex I subunit [Candidatus Sulfotelmatobacter sp.]
MAQRVRVYQPPKTAMQSGRALTHKWVVEFEPDSPREVEPLMGWISGRDTRRQVKLHFETREEALAYAERNGYRVELEEPHARRLKPKSYADNFRPDRLRG